MLSSIIGFWEQISSYFRPFFSWIKEFFSAIPLLLYLTFFLGVALAVGAIYLTKYFLKKQKEQEESQAKSEEIDKYSLPPRGGFISEFLVRKGFLKVGRMSSYLLYSLDFLEKSIKSSDYKYKKPWFLVLGATGSGKSTLMQHFDLTSAPWQNELVEGIDTECNWFFLPNGVALDIKGALFLEKENIAADEIGWESLKRLLARYRSAKPIDSIILTISAEDLYGKNRIPKLQCIERAKYISQKLSLFQDYLGIKIPVYVIITKTDIIPGYKEFCKNIPADVKNQMFGWSNPYSIDTAYMPSWTQEAVSSVAEKVIDINMDICCNDALNKPKDSLFVFPYELEKVGESLLIYTDQIFKADSYKSNVLLRGIFFIGDSGIDKIEIDSENKETEFLDENLLDDKYDGVELGAEDPTEPQKQIANIELSKRLFFCRDLIYKKILEEYSLCSPQKNSLLFANKSLRIAKITTAVMLLIGGGGFYFASKSFNTSRSNLMPVINSMYRFLVETQQIPLTELSKKNEAFEGAVTQLADIMQELSSAKLSSIFIPASWFSPLRSKLNELVNLAYQNIIMRALYVNLLLKARELLHLSPKDIKPNSSVAQLVLPTKSNEFKAMNNFVKKLSELSSFIDKFNDLRLVASPKVLAELVEYAFGMTLSQSFLKYYGGMRKKLNTEAFPEVDLIAYKGLARKTLSDLFHEFFNVIFIHSSPRSFPAVLDLLIRQLRNLDANGLPDLEFMRHLCIDLNAAVKTFEDRNAAANAALEDPKDAKPASTEGINADKPLETWMDKEVFEPDEEFETFLCEVDKSPFFGKDISQIIVNNCAVGLFHLKQNLREVTKILTTDIRFAPEEGKEEEGACSAGLILLVKSLKTLFEETYMRKPSHHRFIEKVPEGQTLYWDDKLLKAACELCEQYESFSTKKVGSFPVVLQESFRLLARDSLQKNIISLIAQSQNFISLPVLQNDSAIEEHVRSKSANLRLVYPHLLKLLELLNYESVSFFYISLRDLLAETNYQLLSQINNLMKKMGPYHIWDPSFSWWDGKKCPAYMAYGVKDSQDLNSFLNIQSQHVMNIALNLAQPVIEFLTNNIMLSTDPLDNNKLTKWKRILDQAEAFNKKQPGNSIAELESFITTTFKEYTINNAFEKISINEVTKDVGDHFLETKQFIQRGILGRAEILTRQKSIKNYYELREFFNKNLRGRFPFTPPSTDSSNGLEVDPEDMRLFFEKFRKAGGTTEKILNQIYQLGIATEAVRFLKSIEQIYELFKSYLETDIGSLPSVLTSVDFNVNRDRAVSANCVAEWSIRENYDEVLLNTEKSRQTKWVYGCPIEISFRWPVVKGFDETPLNDPKQPSLKVIGPIATFTFKGKWSILRLLRQQSASKSEYSAMVNPDSIVLKFIIPTNENKNAILYNSISLLGPSTNPNMPGKSLPLPEFPTFAPDLPDEMARYLNEPVLSSGLIQVAEGGV
ncbi:MAG: hypothetical protein LBS83_02395 [Holosporales bacterium]|nr:hypothetical protein [Holosporales bacterium]